MIYDNIHRIAKLRGITIVELERRCEMSKGSIFKWTKHSPTVANLNKVAEKLEVDISELLKEGE